MSNSHNNQSVPSLAATVSSWLVLLVGLLHAGVFLAGDLSVLPAGLVVLFVSASGGFGLLVLASMIVTAWALVAVAVASAVSVLQRSRST